MKKYFLGISAAFLLSFGVSSAATLTQQQLDAIVGLLRSFGADQSVISSVESSLGGQSVIPPPAAGTAQQQERSSIESDFSDEGRPFTATSNINVRSDPGAGVVVATMPAGSEGLIFGEPFYYALHTWEYVVFDAGPQGWVATEFGTKKRSSTSPFPEQCYAGTWPKPGSKCTANADGASYTCGGATYRKPTLSPCTISAPDVVYPNEPFTVSVTGGTDQLISVGEWRGPLSPAMCPITLTNCTGNTCTLQATATQPGTLFVGFFTHKPAPGGINVYGPTCRKVIRAQVRVGGTTPPPPPADGALRIGGLTPPPPPPAPVVPPPPPAAQLTTPPPPPPAASCANNWNASTGGYFQKPGTSCPCTYFDGQGRQTIGLPVSASCAPVVQAPYVPESGLNFSPQRAGSPQAGRVVWSNEAGSNVYTGTDFPTGAEPSLIKTYTGGWLACSPGSYISQYGFLVRSSGGNDAIFKENGTAEEDGVYYWGTLPDGSYQWIPMTLEEYYANPGRQYARAGWNGVPYAPNCVINLMVGTLPEVVAVPPPPPAPLVLAVGASVRVSALPASTAGANYRNDPLPDGSCGAVAGEMQVGTRGTVIGPRNVCTTDGRVRWKIRFANSAEGWVTQNRLEVVSPTSRAPSVSDPAIANTLEGLRRSIESLQNLIGQH